MRARTTLAATAIAVSAALLLTACGSDAKPSGIIKGAQTVAPSPSATMASGAQRPVITFPPDAKNVFEDQHTGDSKKDAVLADNAQDVNAVYDAILTGNVDLPALKFYDTGNALFQDSSFIQGFLDKGDSWTGTIRYFSRRVTLNPDGSASVIYCSDESQANLKDRKTGEVKYAPTTADSYALYNTRLKQNEQGVWQTENVTSYRGVKECQP